MEPVLLQLRADIETVLCMYGELELGHFEAYWRTKLKRDLSDTVQQLGCTDFPDVLSKHGQLLPSCKLSFKGKGKRRTAFVSWVADGDIANPVQGSGAHGAGASTTASSASTSTVNFHVSRPIRSSGIFSSSAAGSSTSRTTVHQLAAQRPHACARRMDENEVDNLMREIRRRLCGQQKHAGCEYVVDETCKELGVSSLRGHWLNYDKMPYYVSHQQTHTRVMYHIGAYRATRVLATVHDLECYICNRENVKSFEELLLGPITRHPAVIKNFELSPGLLEVAKVTPNNVMDCLIEVLGNGNSINLRDADAVEALQEAVLAKLPKHINKQGVAIPNLGVRINGRAFPRFTWATIDAIRDSRNLIRKMEHVATETLDRKKNELMDARLDMLDEIATYRSDLMEKVKRTLKLVKNNFTKELDLCSSGTLGVIHDADHVEWLGVAKRVLDLLWNFMAINKWPADGIWNEIRHCQQQAAHRMEDTSVSSHSESDAEEDWLGLGDEDPAYLESLDAKLAYTACPELSLSLPQVHDLHLVLTKLINAVEGSEPLQGGLSVLGVPNTGCAPMYHSHSTTHKISALELQQAVKELNMGTSPVGLARLEAALMERFHVTSFSALGHGQTLLACLSSDNNSELLDIVSGTDTGAPHGCVSRAFLPLQTVVGFTDSVMKALDVSPAMCAGFLAGCQKDSADLAAANEFNGNHAVALENAICGQFDVRAVEELGHGSLNNIVKLWLEAFDNIADSAVALVVPAYALVAESPDVESMVGGGEPLAMMDKRGCSLVESDELVSAAVASITTAPVLGELTSWCRWDDMYAHALGPLSAFVTREDVADRLPQQLRLVALPSGGLVKVMLGSVDEDFADALRRAALRRGSASEAVVHMLSVAVGAGGVASAPLGLMCERCADVLKASAAEAGFSCLNPADKEAAAATPPSTFDLPHGLLAPCQLVLDMLTYLARAVPPFLVVLADKVLLPALRKVVDRSTYAAGLLACCSSSEGYQTLHYLGLKLGVEEWIHHWRSTTLRAQQSLADAGGAAGPEPQPLDDNLHGLLSQNDAPPLVPHANAANEDQLLFSTLLHSNRLLEGDSQDDASIKDAGKGSLQGSSGPEEAGNQQVAGGDGTAAASGVDGMSPQQRVVEQIRQSYSVGVEFSCDAERERSMGMNERLRAAVEKLSVDLYSDEVHFVLELVQNAEDNRYDQGVVPSLEFIRDGAGIWVLNNEVGFKADDIRRLSDIGKSSKKNCSGYIGQKGIGFKSVFNVTDAPQIHSQGFHISFDVRAHALGYVLPQWISAPDESLLRARPLLPPLAQASTRIYLPFKEDRRAQLEGRGALFADIDNRLLLFLKKLKCIAIQDKLAGKQNVMVRQGVLQPMPDGSGSAGVLEMRHGSNAEHKSRWLVVTSAFLPGVRRGDQVGSDKCKTELSLAFPLDVGPSGPQEQQRVFAFLPLRCYGLRFIVNADFLVPASRESIDASNAWNQVIRQQVPDLFMKSLAWLEAQPRPDGCSEHYWLNYWLQCLPLKAEAQEFFHPLPEGIASLARAAPIIPTVGGDRVSVVGKQVSLLPSSELAELLAEPPLKEALQKLGINFVHPDLQVLQQKAPVRQLLGISEFQTHDLVKLLRTLCADQALERLGMALLARLLLAVFRGQAQGQHAAGSRLAAAHYFAGHGGGSSTVMAELARLPLLPLAGGRGYAAAKSGGSTSFPVFLPLQGLAGSGPSAKDSVCHKLLQQVGLEAADLGLQVLDAQLVRELADDQERDVFMSGLKALGVRDMEPLDVMHYAIIPKVLQPPQALQADTHLLVASLAFPLLAGLITPQAPPRPATTQHTTATSAAAAQPLLQQLRSVAVILTNAGPVRACAAASSAEPPPATKSGAQEAGPGGDAGGDVSAHIYLVPPLCQAAPNWAVDFPSCKHMWTTVDPQPYLAMSAVRPEDWCWLMTQFGVCTALPVQPLVVRLNQDEVESSQWRDVAAQFPPWPKHGAEGWQCEVQDWVCPQWRALTDQIRADSDPHSALEQLRRLVRVMDAHWGAAYAGALSASCRLVPCGSGPAQLAARQAAGAVQTQPSHVPSCFLRALKDTAWIPCTSSSVAAPVEAHDGGHPPTPEPQTALQQAAICTPAQCFIRKDKLEKVFIGRLPFVDMAAPAAGLSEKFVHDLGIRQQLTPQVALDVLKGWSRAAAQAQGKFISNRHLMQSVYKYLGQQMRHEYEDLGNHPGPVNSLVYEAFHSDVLPLMWVPDVKEQAAEADVAGQFMLLQNVRIYDGTRTMENVVRPTPYPLPRILSLYYNQLTWSHDDNDKSGNVPFFYYLDVKDYPTSDEYFNLLKVLASETPVTKAAFDAVVAVFTMWSVGIEKEVLDQEYVTGLRHLLASWPVFPTTCSTWASLLHNHIYMTTDDDTQVAELFAHHSHVCFLRVPPASNIAAKDVQSRCSGKGNYRTATIERLLKELGVPYLSNHVTCRVSVGGTSKYNVRVGQIVAMVLQHVQPYLYHTSPDLHSAMSALPSCTACSATCIAPCQRCVLRRLQCVAPDELAVRYHLALLRYDVHQGRCHATGAEVDSEAVPRGAALQGHVVYVKDLKNDGDIAEEVSRVFNGGYIHPHTAEFIAQLMMVCKACMADALNDNPAVSEPDLMACMVRGLSEYMAKKSWVLDADVERWATPKVLPLGTTQDEEPAAAGHVEEEKVEEEEVEVAAAEACDDEDPEAKAERILAQLGDYDMQQAKAREAYLKNRPNPPPQSPLNKQIESPLKEQMGASLCWPPPATPTTTTAAGSSSAGAQLLASWERAQLNIEPLGLRAPHSAAPCDSPTRSHACAAPDNVAPHLTAAASQLPVNGCEVEAPGADLAAMKPPVPRTLFTAGPGDGSFGPAPSSSSQFATDLHAWLRSLMVAAEDQRGGAGHRHPNEHIQSDPSHVFTSSTQFETGSVPSHPGAWAPPGAMSGAAGTVEGGGGEGRGAVWQADIAPEDQASAIEPLPETRPSREQMMLANDAVSAILPDARDRKAESRWGEALVYHHLLQLLQPQPGEEAAWAVIWANKDEETFKPYDIEVRTPGGEVACFIEVKTTTALDKHDFELSFPEMSAAWSQRKRYYIYRVYGAGSPTAFIRVVPDPVGMYKRRQIGMSVRLASPVPCVPSS